MDKQSDRFLEQKRRSFWLKHLHQWHWISSAICLVGMLLFAATGITLNHASQIEAKPRVVSMEAQLPPELADALSERSGSDKAPLPTALREWLLRHLSVPVGDQPAEWSAEEIYLSLPRPGGDAWVSIELPDGAVRYERTDRGWVSYLNDLHKGRNTGEAWKWFLDIFAVACLVFCVTGFFLLHMHARNRPVTWPMVALGVAVPVFLALVFIH